MMGNFNPGYLHTTFYPAGYFDSYDLDTSDIATSTARTKIEKSRETYVTSPSGFTTYDLLFKPPCGILNSKKPLLPKTEMIISFDRAAAELALIDKTAEHSSALAGKVLDLSNVFLRADYYSTPYLRNHFATITSKQISYKYDECSVYHKNLPQGTNIIRMSNIIGGNTPSYIFCGIIDSEALNGDFKRSSTAFKRHGVKEFDLTLDGYSVHGFPIVSENGSPVAVYDKFMKTTNRKFDNNCAEQCKIGNFSQFAYLYGHKFDGEVSETGWIGVNLKLDAPYEKNYTMGKQTYLVQVLSIYLVIWASHEIDLRIDQFHRIEKMIL